MSYSTVITQISSALPCTVRCLDSSSSSVASNYFRADPSGVSCPNADQILTSCFWTIWPNCHRSSPSDLNSSRNRARTISVIRNRGVTSKGPGHAATCRAEGNDQRLPPLPRRPQRPTLPPAAPPQTLRETPLFVLDPRIPRKPVRPYLKGADTVMDDFPDGGGFDTSENHKSGYVAIIGRPNAGKSTLLNHLIGQKLSIVTKKPQTTRHRILGICSGKDYQMILYDTPGVMARRMHKLDEVMMQNVRSAAVSADVIICLVDICQAPETVVDMLQEAALAANERRPLLLLLNKRDLIKPGEVAQKLKWYEANSRADEVVAVSAKLGHGCEDVKKWALGKLPKGPAYYPKDVVSEHPERFFVSEIVREKILLQYQQEIPYVCQVNVLNYVEREGAAKDLVSVEIVVERESQKGVMVGKNGGALKILATAARMDIEDFVGRPIFLEVIVKVQKEWRQDEKFLSQHGLHWKG